MPRGQSVHYVSAATGTLGHRPIPMADDTTRRTTHTPTKPKPRGLDWDSLTPTGRCGHKSTRLNRDDLCPDCAAPGTANVERTPRPKKGRTECATCGRESRFLHGGICAICKGETTPLVLDATEPEIVPPAPQDAPHAAESSPTPTAATPPPLSARQDPTDIAVHAATAPYPSLAERCWSILIATEDCSGDAIAAMMRRSAIAALEALWLHWRLHHQTPAETVPTEAPSPAAVHGDAEGGEPAGPSRKGKPAEPDRLPSHAKPRARRLTPEQEREVCDRYVAGESTPDLGKAYGLAASGIRGVLVRNQIPRRASGTRTHITR